MNLLIHHHLGLGDHLICNALVRHLALKHGDIGLFAYRRNVASVAFMYRDDPRISVMPVDSDAHASTFAASSAIPALRIGFEHLGCSGRSFAEDFYAQLSLDYRMRFEAFHFRRDFERERALFERLVGGAERHIFLHEDRTRGFAIDRANIASRLPIVVPEIGITDNIFDYVGIVEKAEEIHLIDSAFLSLVDSIRIHATRLVYHRYARPLSPDIPSLHAREDLYRQRWHVGLTSIARRKYLGFKRRLSNFHLGG